MSFLRPCALLSRLRTRGVTLATRRHLPICTIDTNLPVDVMGGSFKQDLSAKIASVLNKPEKLISVVVRADTPICRNKSEDPTIFIQIWSVGVFGADSNPAYSREFFNFIMEKTNLPSDRIALLLHPIEKYDAGHLLYADSQKQQNK